MKLKYILISTLLSAALSAQTQKDSIRNVEQINLLIKKKLIERKADRLIFNVEASVASQGMDATETLANVPMLKVDENMGSISITGKSTVSVMINGRMLNLSGNALLNYLKSIRSENISRIEVITTPPSKYEAQGNSGLINIILKKNPNLGFSGNINSINRPSMSNLNPFRWYENPYSYSSGNPLLTPAYINNLELGYTLNNKFSASVYYLRMKNGFGQISYIDELSQTSTYLNYYNNNFLGLNASYTDIFFKFWETNLSLNASLQNSSVFNIQAQTQKGSSFSYSINNTFTLNKNKTLVFFLNYSHSLAYKNVNSYFQAFPELTSGLKVSLMEKKLQINATITNIFAQRYRGELYFSDNTQYMNNYWDGRSFRLSVNYTFGSGKKKISKKNINFEEKERAQ